MDDDAKLINLAEVISRTNGRYFVTYTARQESQDDALSSEELDYLDRVMEIHDYRYRG